MSTHEDSDGDSGDDTDSSQTVTKAQKKWVKNIGDDCAVVDCHAQPAGSCVDIHVSNEGPASIASYTAVSDCTPFRVYIRFKCMRGFMAAQRLDFHVTVDGVEAPESHLSLMSMMQPGWYALNGHLKGIELTKGQTFSIKLQQADEVPGLMDMSITLRIKVTTVKV